MILEEVLQKVDEGVEKELVERLVKRAVDEVYARHEQRINHHIGALMEQYQSKFIKDLPL